MSAAHLGETFDIHGGGIDLVFPHHENEIAQSCCAFGQDVMANYWMHNGFLQVEGEKMSKSLGNFVTIHELLHTEKFGGRRWPGEVLRLAMLRTHYRQPIDWTVKALEEAETKLTYWMTAIDFSVEPLGSDGRIADQPLRSDEVPSTYMEALSDDLNTPLAMQILDRAFSEPRTDRVLSIMLGLSGIDLNAFRASRHARDQAFFDKHGDTVDRFISARNAARASKNWAESDRIRDELAAMGIALKDNKDGTTTWEVKR
jgi:cysteinyl-tRNA synthetase